MWPLKLIIQPVLQSGFEFSLRRHSDNHLSFFFPPQSWMLHFGYKTSRGGGGGGGEEQGGGGGLKNLPQFRLLQSRLAGSKLRKPPLSEPPPHVPKNKHPKTLKTQSLPRLVLRRVGTKNATVKSTTSQGLSYCGRWDSLLLPLLLLPTRRGQVHPHTLR